MPTDPDTENLSPQMLVAVEAPATGANVTEAAEAAGVTHQTCSEWLNRSTTFQAAKMILTLSGFGVVAIPKQDPQGVDLAEGTVEAHGHLCGKCMARFTCSETACASFECNTFAACRE